MRTNCPYCGVWLSFEGASASVDWMFLRCAKCSSLCIAKSESKKKVVLPKHVFSPLLTARPESGEAIEVPRAPSQARSRRLLFLGILGTAVFAASFLVDSKILNEPISVTQDRAIVTHQAAPSQVHEVQKVEVKVPQATLRSGPGTGFRKMGVASPGTQFSVLGQEQQWIKVEILGTGLGLLSGVSESVAWIRSDLVKAISFINSIEVAP